jgi:lipoate---protein ligase
MLCIVNTSTDPYFNLAAEEYLLHNFNKNCFMLWRNENSIVVGKHQNPLAEINRDFVREKNIRVARRISGGGTVYHDTGNLNFTFITDGKEGHLVDFRKHTLPILEALHNLSVNARFKGRNDLAIDDKKISGNAEHVYRKRVLHHGTLLFSSNLDDLNLALKVNPSKYTSKAVKSIRSQVTNIREHLKTGMDILQFRDMIMEHVMSRFPGSEYYVFTREDIKAIKDLKTKKYSTWEWIYGYSPEYELENTLIINSRNLILRITVSGGIIIKATISGDLQGDHPLNDFEKVLEGVRHYEHDLSARLGSYSFPEGFFISTPGEFIRKYLF